MTLPNPKSAYAFCYTLPVALGTEPNLRLGPQGLLRLASAVPLATSRFVHMSSVMAVLIPQPGHAHSHLQASARAGPSTSNAPGSPRSLPCHLPTQIICLTQESLYFFLPCALWVGPITLRSLPQSPQPPFTVLQLCSHVLQLVIFHGLSGNRMESNLTLSYHQDKVPSRHPVGIQEAFAGQLID